MSGLWLGCMSFGSSRWRPWVLDEPAALPLLDAAVNAGITHFDTANVYSGGESERILGRYLRSRNLRQHVTLATKLFYDTPERLHQTGLGRENVLASAEASLRRLQVEALDLLQIHRWDPQTPIEETLLAFDVLIRSGKVTAIGASNLTAWQLAKSQLAAVKLGVAGFTAVQPHYNLLYREEERDLLPFCADQDIAVMPWSPLARGRLLRPYAQQSTARARNDDVADTLYGPKAHQSSSAIVAALQALAAECGESPASLALAWLQARGTAPVFGATRAQHILEAARAASISLTPQQMLRLESPYRAMAHLDLPYTSKNQAETASLSGDKDLSE